MPLTAIKTSAGLSASGSSLIGKSGILVIPRNHLAEEDGHTCSRKVNAEGHCFLGTGNLGT